MLVEKSFGEKIQDINYIDRVGAYGVILNEENKVAVVKTKKGYFLLGGRVENEETHEECIKRECSEEVGMDVVVKNFICKGGKYDYIDSIGYFYGIGYFYFAEFIDIASKPKEKGHELLWVHIQDCCKYIHLEHQQWAVHQAINILNNKKY